MLVCPLPLRMCVCQEARRQFRQWCWPWPGSSRRGPPSSSWCTWGWRAGHGRGKSYWWPSLCSFRRTSFRNSSHSQRPERNRCILLISQIWKHRPIIRDMLLKWGGFGMEIIERERGIIISYLEYVLFWLGYRMRHLRSRPLSGDPCTLESIIVCWLQTSSKFSFLELLLIY